MNKTLIVNLFGGPGCGKSTMASALFVELKRRGINCELVTEFAKDKVWEESYQALDDQIYIFGQQHHRQFILDGKVDVIITDSPTLLSIIYSVDTMPHRMYRHFFGMVMTEFEFGNNFNIFMQRSKLYDKVGRMGSLKEGIQIDEDIRTLLNHHSIPCLIHPFGDTYIDDYVNHIIDLVEKNKHKALYTTGTEL